MKYSNTIIEIDTADHHFLISSSTFKNALTEFAFLVSTIRKESEKASNGEVSGVMFMDELKKETLALLEFTGSLPHELADSHPAKIRLDGATQTVEVEGDYDNVIFALAIGCRMIFLIDSVWEDKKKLEQLFDILGS